MWKWLWNWVKSRNWKSFEMHIRKSLHCYERSLKAILERAQKSSTRVDSLSSHVQKIGSSMNDKGHSDEVSGGNEKLKKKVTLVNWQRV